MSEPTLETLLKLVEQWQNGTGPENAAEYALATFDVRALKLSAQQHAEALRFHQRGMGAGPIFISDEVLAGFQADLRAAADFLAPPTGETR